MMLSVLQALDLHANLSGENQVFPPVYLALLSTHLQITLDTAEFEVNKCIFPDLLNPKLVILERLCKYIKIR